MEKEDLTRIGKFAKVKDQYTVYILYFNTIFFKLWDKLKTELKVDTAGEKDILFLACFS